MFELQSHGADVFVGEGPRYPWGGLYGGQIVAQAVRAAASTVDGDRQAHSIRAYFIRPGDHAEPIRYEVDRIRNGRSFVTRRVVARQAIGAILNAEASFQTTEPGPEVAPIVPPAVAAAESLEPSPTFSEGFERRDVPAGFDDGTRSGAGRVAAWFRVVDEIGPLDAPGADLLHRCWLAYLSDDSPSETVRHTHPVASNEAESEHFSSTSLDHTIWFHRPLRADRWHLHDFTCHHFVGGRGLAVGHVFDATGQHCVTVAQEVLVRDRRHRPS